MKATKKYTGILWTARLIGTLLVVLTLTIGIGEKIGGFQNNMESEPFDNFQIVIFIFWFLCLAGLIWAWWNEGAGGIFSFISTVIFLILVKTYTKINPDASFTVILFIFLVPSVLYLIYWWLTKKSQG